MSMIKADSISKIFTIQDRENRRIRKPLNVLKNVSLTVEQNEVVCIIGPSGAGKSTFLRCLNHLETIDDGQIYIEDKLLFDCHNGKNKVKMNNNDRNKILLEVGMVFQQFNLFPHKTALENVKLAPIHVRKLSEKEAHEKSIQILEKVGLSDKIDSYPSALSGGQQQRLAIARSLVMQPRIMLFDEPTSSLDPELSSEVLSVMKQLVLDGMTMIVVSHEMGFAREAADKVVFMEKGAFLETGSPKQILENPVNDRIKQFIQSV